MDINSPDKPQLFIDNLERGLRENIIRLDQKLKGLNAEIDAKLENISLIEEENRDEYVAKLSKISQEIKEAIAGIGHLVNLVSSEDEEARNAFLQSEEMQKFSEMIAENLEKITEIKKNF